MEVVSVSPGLKEVLTGPSHSTNSCKGVLIHEQNSHQNGDTNSDKPDEVTDEDYHSKMDTDIEEKLDANQMLTENADESKTCNNQMDCEDESGINIPENETTTSNPEADTMDFDASTSSSDHRKNKRKNFQPRSISVNCSEMDSEQNGDEVDSSKSSGVDVEDDDTTERLPLDLSDAPIRIAQKLTAETEKLENSNENPASPKIDEPAKTFCERPVSPKSLLRMIEPTSETSDGNSAKSIFPDYTQLAMRKLLSMYGLPQPHQLLSPNAGKLVQEQNQNPRENSGSNSDGESGGAEGREPPTPPHTPQREGRGLLEGGDPSGVLGGGFPHRVNTPFQHLEPLQQQALHARMMGGGGLSTFLTLAALHENSNGINSSANTANMAAAVNAAAAAAAAVSAPGSIPLPPSLDPHRSLPVTPTTPSSTAVTPGLAELSLGGYNNSAPSMVVSRDPLAKSSVDYSRYVKRFSSSLECGNPSCRELNQSREHFHCIECRDKIFSKKEEMIRHFKWHKKRDESLQHGFMRYSPTDDCSDRFPGCSHNRKQTHYHCLKENCDKTYISTSDVQMHANYHRKDSAIMQEGFQRYRASEDCAQPDCPYSGQRTTHFHCRRDGCNYNFKNKADMEKHKSYHIKDEQLTKDGFKKFMKHEDCSYEGCKFSRVVNHIHCIREDCHYVLHSSNQIFAHKRKHERQDHDQNYRRYRLAQTMLGIHDSHPALNPLLHEALRPVGNVQSAPMLPLGPDTSNDGSCSPTMTHSTGVPPTPSFQRPPPPFLMGGFPSPNMMDPNHPLARFLGSLPQNNNNSLHDSFPSVSTASSSSNSASLSEPSSPVDLTTVSEDKSWERYVCHVSREDPCNCEITGTEHWHCESCDISLSSKDSARDHSRIHEQLSIITEDQYIRVVPGEDQRPCHDVCPFQDRTEHYHCREEGCEETIAASDKPLRRLEHSRMHDYSRSISLSGNPSTSPNSSSGFGNFASITSIDAMFKRKRGRPPKNRIIEVPGGNQYDSPPAIFTSFKLPKSSPPLLPFSGHSSLPSSMMSSFPHMSSSSPLSHLAQLGREATRSPPLSSASLASVINNSKSVYSGAGVSDFRTTLPKMNINMLPLNGPIMKNPVQHQGEQIEGFTSWSEGSPCPDQICPLLGNRHYHCSHPRCLFVTSNSDVLPVHARDFHETTHIPEGFLSIDHAIDCRLPSCQSNKQSKHFHCTRCSYSFADYRDLEPHHDKHLQDEQDAGQSSSSGQSFEIKTRPDSPMDAPSTSLSSGESPMKSQAVVKSSGIFYPLSPFPNIPQGGTRTSTPRSEPGALVIGIPPSASNPHTIPTFSLPVSSGFTITSAPRISQVPPSTPPMLSDNSGEMSNIKMSVNLSPKSSTSHTEDSSSNHDLSTAMSSDSLNASSIVPEKLLPEHHPQYSETMLCGRPFCKLKKKEHFHCQLCNQAFSEQDKLGPHLQKHLSGSGFVGKTEDEEEPMVESGDDRSCHSPINITDRFSSPSSPIPSLSKLNIPITSFGLNMSAHQMPPQFSAAHLYSQAPSFPGFPSPFAHPLSMAGIFPPGSLPRLLPPSAWPGVHPALAAMAHPVLMMGGPRMNGELPKLPTSDGSASISPPGLGLPSSMSNHTDIRSLLPSSLGTSPHLALLGKRMGADDFPGQEPKKIRPATHSLRLSKDEPVPEGYYRFRFNEDCQYPHCGYREHQTHFHCMRKDCGYSFCDKTRFVQHTARHDRLDTLMGGDFQQYRSNVSCGRSDCVYSSIVGRQQNKASHFHCMKCEFVCTDTNKVVAHRRQHQKRDSINAAGFEKFTPSQPCGVTSCNHNQKQTHYHCLKCNYSVLGLSQMSAHKFRHMD